MKKRLSSKKFANHKAPEIPNLTQPLKKAGNYKMSDTSSMLQVPEIKGINTKVLGCGHVHNLNMLDSKILLSDDEHSHNGEDGHAFATRTFDKTVSQKSSKYDTLNENAKGLTKQLRRERQYTRKLLSKFSTNSVFSPVAAKCKLSKNDVSFNNAFSSIKSIQLNESVLESKDFK